ncbi:hypothetical protein C6P40_001478 [Pichia californica]|uniref:Uncharacterized protein n=1 Tax=Pichia californica TaxID=460514 RepID=A0A9P6WJ15_9ASCO|nr:hypothetical protein C6P42_001545 [[Candida] californica]KAG0688041.1 hypothetical protein C6P40_001478 [[Candida] californica]
MGSITTESDNATTTTTRNDKLHENFIESDDDESDSDSITMSLERIGVTIPSFMMPKIDMPKIDISKRINNYFVQSVYMDNSSSSNIKEILGDLINKKTTDLKTLYSEVSQSLTGIVNVNIDHPIEEYIDEINSNNIKKDNDNNEINEKNLINEKNDLKILNEYQFLTYLTFEQFQDQMFLRRRIREILSLNIQPVLQRLLIQKLMSRSYIEKQKHMNLQTPEYNEINKHKHESDNDNAKDHEHIMENNENDDDSSDDMEEDEVLLTDKDMQPTYHNFEEGILGCEHYQRNCKAECPTCHKWYTCRFCHDKIISSHQLDRKKVKHILCMFCFTPQHPGQYCIECNRELSKYYCSKCKLFDNDALKNIYHCDKCDICRLGLGLNQDYFHCDSCNACISIDLQKNHVCIENSTKSNCPICDEFMFNSNEKVVFMSCGHPIHEKCYGQHTIHSYKCPTCSKTIVNMELQFRMRDSEIKQSQMPDEVKNWNTEIKCNDCGGMSRVPFHYLGHKCDHCHSYNNMQVKLIKDNEIIEPVEISSNNTDEKLNISEKFLTDSLKQNFEFAEVNERLKMDGLKMDGLKEKISEEDHSIDHDYVENFIRVINNFEAYSSISDAFKDWISTSLEHDISDDENEQNEQQNEQQNEIKIDTNNQ